MCVALPLLPSLSKSIDELTQSESSAEERWLQDVPWGFRALLNYLAARYQKPIYVTENGFAVKGESGMSKEKALREPLADILFSRRV